MCSLLSDTLEGEFLCPRKYSNTLISHLRLVDKCACSTLFTEYMWWSYSPVMPPFFFFNQKKQEVFLTSSWADHVPLYPSPPFGRRQHSVHLYGIPAQPPGSSQGTSWEGKARSGAWASTDIAWFRGIHPSATLTENNRQSPNILIVHSGEKLQNGYKRKNTYGYS